MFEMKKEAHVSRSVTRAWLAAIVVLYAGCADSAPAVPAAVESPLAAELNALVAPYDLDDGPGGVLGIFLDGELVHARGFGLANIEYGLENSPQTVFRVGSVSKQFAAMSMALLADDSVIDLDDEIQKYVPEIPRYDQPVTIRHLIHHTSGLRDYNELATLAGRRADLLGTTEETLELLARQRGLNFPPGTRFMYSNSGYFLIPVIVERVTGMAIAEFAEARMFEPLGMTHTRFKDDRGEVVPDRAYGYVANDEDGWRLYMSQRDFVGAGGVFTTLGDMLEWDRNFYENKIGSPDLIATTLTRGSLNDGTEIDYAFGLTRGEDRGLPTVEHGGAFAAFTAYMLRYPEQRLTVVTMRNGGEANVARLARQAADLYLDEIVTDLPEREAPESPSATPTSAPAPTMAWRADQPPTSYAGDYYSAELDARYRIEADEQNLALTIADRDAVPLTPMSGDTFEASGLTLHFRSDSGGHVGGFLLDGGRVRGLDFVRTGP